ncbi:MAG: DUF1501 domain-containing protein [Burkholderiales bacterium]|nr:DUF1501 domain-containing protein [Burkholderiales bacterium]
MSSRRNLLGAMAGLGSLGVAGLVGHLAGPAHAVGEDYRALVVLFLTGGNDGNNLIVPTDAMYGDYQAARQNLALSKASLLALSGTAGGQSFGVHPALAKLVPLYNQGRLGFIANAGPLVVPTTALQAKNNAVDLPPFLLSHNDQVAIQQGWTVQDDSSGWAGRGLELLPSELRHPINAVTMSSIRTLVLGKRSSVSFMARDGSRYWGPADLANPKTLAAQQVNRMAQWQFANLYEAEFARTFGGAVDDSTRFTQALLQAKDPTADFGSGNLADTLRALAKVLPTFKAQGYKRQVFLVTWGSFDTHTNQRGSDAATQDAQFALMASALAGFDEANRVAGLDMNVMTLMMSDFGRTVRPGSGGGSEHAWGNHWFALGGPVHGGTVHGSFPSPVLGGADDGDRNRNGRFVPTTSTDQVGASVMQWLGLDPSAFHEVFPNLANFPQKTIPLLRV